MPMKRIISITFASLLFLLWLASSGLAVFIISATFFEKNASSTSVIAIIPALILLVFSLAFKTTFSSFFNKIVPLDHPKRENRIFVFRVSSIIVLVGCFLYGIYVDHTLAEEAKARVILNNPGVTRTDVIRMGVDLNGLTQLKEVEDSELVKPFDWNGKKYNFAYDDNGIVLKDSNNVALEKIKMFTYVTKGTISVIGKPPKEKLILFADMRATSRRAMLLIFSESGQAIYRELLERCRYDRTHLYKRKGSSGDNEVIVDVDDSYLHSYSIKEE
jgi:hypothetical protein